MKNNKAIFVAAKMQENSGRNRLALIKEKDAGAEQEHSPADKLMRSIQHLQTTMLMAQTNELDAGQELPTSQLRNFQIASLSIPKNRKGLKNKGPG